MVIIQSDFIDRIIDPMKIINLGDERKDTGFNG